jgi:hypothetical protein
MIRGKIFGSQTETRPVFPVQLAGLAPVFSPPLDLGLPGGLTFFMDLEAKYVTGILRGLQSKSAPKV